MIHAQHHSPSVPMFSRQLPALFAPIVDRATTLALRRTVAGSRDKRRCCGITVPSVVSNPRILNLPATMGAHPMDVPVVIVHQPSSACEILPVGPQDQIDRIRLDLSWIAALFVALSVTLAIAIPLELLG